jgi:hypothetical protein
MAKDPAILWYWSDWNSGTATFTRFLKGCYIDLLHAQFNSGPLSLEEIKVVLGSDFGQAWPTLSKKFKSENGFFFNERLELEKNKRKAFSESRRQNRSKKTLVKDMINICESSVEHMENENRNINKRVRKEGVGENLSDFEIGKTIEYVQITAQRLLKEMDVKNYYTAFKIATDSHYHHDRQDEITHFRNWLKLQPNGNKGNKRNATGDPSKPGTALSAI